MITATDIASYISDKHGIYRPDNRRLQKLVYFSQAWSLAWTGKPLFDGLFEAWPDGPVERDLWVCQRYSQVPRYAGQLSKSDIDIVEAVLDQYWDLGTSQLVDLSHEEAWSEARQGLPAEARSTKPLDQSTIKRLYVSRAINGEGPRRSITRIDASEESVWETASSLVARWKDGLDLLATR